MKKIEFNSIILFDGHCNLCSGLVQFVLKRDRINQFRFASLQGKFGQQILDKLNLSTTQLNTFILVEGDQFYTRSTAALMLARKLSGLWPMLYIFILVPKFMRDAIYKWIAKNRYTWFGKRDTCWMPQSRYTNRFLD